MENAQLIALSRQLALQHQMDVVANNIANLNTTGFKAESILFEDFIMPLASEEAFATADEQVSFTQDWATIHDMRAGAIVETGNPLDVALQGDGFLAVDTPAGERWTRAGALQINAEGILVTPDGHPVQGDGGDIVFEAGETAISIDASGAISTNAGAKGRLRIVEFSEPQALVRDGAGLFAGGTPLPAVATRVVQGAVEKSNVSGVAEISEMMRVQRAYQSVSAMMERQEEIRRSAVQKLGSLSA
jgi:flagellar basal-body rod protein FlgF